MSRRLGPARVKPRAGRAGAGLVLAGVPHMREKEVIVELFGQVEDWRLARGGEAERGRGEGGGGLANHNEPEYGQQQGGEDNNELAGAVRTVQAKEVFARVRPAPLLAELEDDAANKEAGQEEVRDAGKGEVEGLLVGPHQCEDGEVESRYDAGDDEAQKPARSVGGVDKQHHSGEEDLREGQPLSSRGRLVGSTGARGLARGAGGKEGPEAGRRACLAPQVDYFPKVKGRLVVAPQEGSRVRQPRDPVGPHRRPHLEQQCEEGERDEHGPKDHKSLRGRRRQGERLANAMRPQVCCE